MYFRSICLHHAIDFRVYICESTFKCVYEYWPKKPNTNATAACLPANYILYVLVYILFPFHITRHWQARAWKQFRSVVSFHLEMNSLYQAAIAAVLSFCCCCCCWYSMFNIMKYSVNSYTLTHKQWDHSFLVIFVAILMFYLTCVCVCVCVYFLDRLHFFCNAYMQPLCNCVRIYILWLNENSVNDVDSNNDDGHDVGPYQKDWAHMRNSTSYTSFIHTHTCAYLCSQSLVHCLPCNTTQANTHCGRSTKKKFIKRSSL